ncbi:MAG: PadR family transcriptional regulator [Thermoprotei archaeon]|nr:MAG: PadR family transcriptional regulator [Thermoprotei archaeon]
MIWCLKLSVKALERLKRKITIENLWMYIIRILVEQEPLRAYDIKVLLREKYGIKPATVTVYSVIYRMASDNLIKPVQVYGETRYRVTEQGKIALKKAIELLEETVNKLK